MMMGLYSIHMKCLFEKREFNMKIFHLVRWLFVISCILSACEKASTDHTGPVISAVQTSGNVLVISDCAGTSISISANVTDPSNVKSVLLFYRVANEPFASTSMELKDGVYQASLVGSDFLGKGYGNLEFYIQAQDGAGNVSKSSINQSVQFLPCVSS